MRPTESSVPLAEVLARIQHEGLASSTAEAKKRLAYYQKRGLLVAGKRGVGRGIWSEYPAWCLRAINTIAELRSDGIPWPIVDVQVQQIASEHLSALVSPLIQDSILLRFCNTPPHSAAGERFRAAALRGDERGCLLSWPGRELKFVSGRIRSGKDKKFVKASYALAGVLEPEAGDGPSYFSNAGARFHRELTAWMSRVVRDEAGTDDGRGMIDLSSGPYDTVGTHKTFAEFVRHRLGRIAWEAATVPERTRLDALWPALLRRRISQCEHCGRFDLRLDRRRRRFCSTGCRIKHHNDDRSAYPQPQVRYGMEGYVPPVAALGTRRSRAHRMAQLGVSAEELDLFKDVFAPDRTTHAKKSLDPSDGTEGQWHRATRREAKTGERVPLKLKTPDLLRHLLGQDLILGALPSWSEDDGALLTNKIALDIDAGGSPEAEPPFERLVRIEKAIGTPDLVFISSASGGLHAYWFFEQAPVDKARAVVLDRLHAVGEEERAGHIEVYPSATGKQILRLPMGWGGYLVDWEGDWGPTARERWRQLHFVLDVLDELNDDLPLIDDRFARSVSMAAGPDSAEEAVPAAIDVRPSPRSPSTPRAAQDGGNVPESAEFFFTHGIPHEGLRNEICCKYMFFFFARTSSDLEEARSRGIEWIGRQGNTSRLVRSNPARAANYMAYGIERTWAWWQKEQANSTQRSLRGRPRYPSPQTIRAVLRLAMGLMVRRDAKGRALLGMLTLVFTLAKRGHVRNEGMPGAAPATMSTKYFRALPGMTTNPSRPSYYLRILEMLEGADLIERGHDYVQPESRPGLRRSTLDPGEPPRGKELLGTFDVVVEPPDIVALASDEFGGGGLRALGIDKDLQALVTTRESPSTDHPRT